jgi:hypothetical protein
MEVYVLCPVPMKSCLTSLCLQKDGVTPLVFAASRSRADITAALLRRGARVNLQKVGAP